MSIKLLIGSRQKNFWQSWTMFAELVRNNFISDRVTVNSRERLSRTNIRHVCVEPATWLKRRTDGGRAISSDKAPLIATF